MASQFYKGYSDGTTVYSALSNPSYMCGSHKALISQPGCSCY